MNEARQAIILASITLVITFTVNFMYIHQVNCDVFYKDAVNEMQKIGGTEWDQVKTGLWFLNKCSVFQIEPSNVKGIILEDGTKAIQFSGVTSSLNTNDGM